MQKKMSSGLSLVLPVYNEKELVENAVQRCVQILSRDFEDFELILVDDGSTDGTGHLMDELAKRDGHIRVLHNMINLNVGISIQRGFAISTKEFVVHNSVDLPLAIEDIAGLTQYYMDCDILVLERRSHSGYTLWRWITSKVNSMLIRTLFGTGGIRDMNFTQIYRRDAIPRILPLAKSPVFTTPEMILRAKRLDLRVNSVVLNYHPRTIGKGAFGKPHDILWSLYDMLRFRLKMWKSIGRD